MKNRDILEGLLFSTVELCLENKQEKRETGKENLTPRSLRFEVNDDNKKAGSTFPRSRPDSEKGKLVRGPKKKNLVSSLGYNICRKKTCTATFFFSTCFFFRKIRNFFSKFSDRAHIFRVAPSQRDKHRDT